MAKQFLDWSMFTDPNTALDFLRHAIPNTNVFDASQTRNVKGRFKAIIITEVVSLSALASNGLGGEATTSDNASSVAKYYFKARIDPRINPFSPHIFLPDPCDLVESTAPGVAMDAIMLHTSFIMTTTEKDTTKLPKLNDIVEVGLFDGPNGGFNLQHGIFLKKVAKGEKTSQQSGLAAACAALKDAFDGMPRAGPYPAIDTADPESLEAMYGQLRGSPHFSGFSDAFLVGLVANAQAESAFVVDAGGDPVTQFGGRRSNRGIQGYCSWGYWQMNICPKKAEGTLFLEQEGIDPVPEENKPIAKAALTSPDKQFKYVAGRARALMPGLLTTNNAYQAAHAWTIQFENPQDAASKAVQRGNLAANILKTLKSKGAVT